MMMIYKNQVMKWEIKMEEGTVSILGVGFLNSVIHGTLGLLPYSHVLSHLIPMISTLCDAK